MIMKLFYYCIIAKPQVALGQVSAMSPSMGGTEAKMPKMAQLMGMLHPISHEALGLECQG